METMLANGVTVAAPAKPKSEQKSEAPAVRPKPEPVKPGPEVTPPPEYHAALDRVMEQEPSTKGTIPSMRFISFDGSTVTVEFSKKQMMHMKLLERKKPLFESALSDAFGQPVAIRMLLEGERAAAPKPASNVAKRVIEESYDVFGRDKIDLQD